MIQLKINGEWRNTDMLGIWKDNEGKGVYREAEIQDIRAFDADYSYKELLHLSHADIEQKVEQVYSESGLIGDLCKRVSKLEKTLQQIADILGFYETTAKDELGKEIDTLYSSEVLGKLIDRINSLEVKTAENQFDIHVIKEINNNEN